MASGQGEAALLEQWEEDNFLLNRKVLENPGVQVLRRILPDVSISLY